MWHCSVVMGWSVVVNGLGHWSESDENMGSRVFLYMVRFRAWGVMHY